MTHEEVSPLTETVVTEADTVTIVGRKSTFLILQSAEMLSLKNFKILYVLIGGRTDDSRVCYHTHYAITAISNFEFFV